MSITEKLRGTLKPAPTQQEIEERIDSPFDKLVECRVAAMKEQHEVRVTRLLEANNEELERRRKAEAACAALRDALEPFTFHEWVTGPELEKAKKVFESETSGEDLLKELFDLRFAVTLLSERQGIYHEITEELARLEHLLGKPFSMGPTGRLDSAESWIYWLNEMHSDMGKWKDDKNIFRRNLIRTAVLCIAAIQWLDCKKTEDLSIQNVTGV